MAVMFGLDCPPVIGIFLIIQMPNPRDMWAMAIPLRPIDRFFLCRKSRQYVISTILHNVIVNLSSLRPALRSRLNVNYCHVLFFLGQLLPAIYHCIQWLKDPPN